MSTQKDRLNTIIAILNSNSSFRRQVTNKIKREFGQVTAVDSVTPPQRRNILKILHSTRALDTTLNTFLDHHNILNSANTLGQYLWQLHLHANDSLTNITASERAKYQRTIAKVRNTHLHNADSYPQNDGAVYQLISEMEALMTRVATL